MLFARRAIALAGAMLAAALAPASAHAVDPLPIDPAIDRAVVQLDGVQLADGGFGARLALRDTASVGEALRAARPNRPAIGWIDTFLAGRGLEDVDSLARVALGSPAAVQASALLAEQSADGGFGLSRDYQSDSLDTALGLRALTALGEREAAARAAARLLKFASGGAWGTDGGDVALTSEALLALDAYIRRYGSTTAIDAALAAAVAWLGQAQQPGGSWSPGALAVRNTALAVAALASSPAAVDRVGAGAASLLATQQPDGSWGDPYTTALAVRALDGAAEAIERDRVTQLPDPSLRASDLSANPQTIESGKPITIKAAVTNAGLATASGVTAEFYLDDPASGADPVDTADVPEVAPGETAAVDATFSVSQHGRVRAHVVLRAPVGQDRSLSNNATFINVYVKVARNTYERVRDWPRPGRDIQRSGATPNNLHPGIDPDPIWRVPSDAAHIVAEGKVIYADDARMKAVDAKTGSTAWLGDDVYTDDRYRAPVYHAGMIYSSEPGGAGAVNARGEYNYYGIGGWGGSVPLFTHEVVPVDDGYDAVFMYNADASFMNIQGWCYLEPKLDHTATNWTVRHRWQGQAAVPWPGTPGEGRMYFPHYCDGNPLSFASDDTRGFITNGGYLSGFDPATGQGPNGEPVTPLFDVAVSGMHRMPAPPLVDSLGQVVAAGWEGTPRTSPTKPGTQTGKGLVVAVSPSNGAKYWSFTTDTRLDGTPVEHKGTVIVIDRSGKVYALDQITGELEWSWKPAGYVPPAADQQGKSGQTLALSRRYLYLPHPDGHIYTLDARTGAELSATRLNGRPYDLAIDDTNNAIYVRTLDGQLGAYPTREVPDQCLPDPANPPAATGHAERVSLKTGGSQFTGPGVGQERPAISANGRYVAFVTEEPFPYNTQLHVRDLETGQTDSMPPFDQLDANTQRWWRHHPVLSSDGRYLGFAAYHRNFRTGVEGHALYVMDRQTGTLEPVLKKADGTAELVSLEGAYARVTDRENPSLSMSGDGQTIAFASRSKLVPEDTDSSPDVYVVNRVTGARKLVSRMAAGQQVADQSSSASLSRDGRYVAFTSDTSLTGAPISTHGYDGQRPYVHRYDLATDRIENVSVDRSGKVAVGWSPQISGDGRFVTFSSHGPGLLPEWMSVWPYWTGHSTDAFLWDSANRRIELVSVNDSGDHSGIAQALRPVVSDDGQYVAFHNSAALVEGQTTWNQAQITARDRSAGTTRLLSINNWDVSGFGTSLAPVVSGDGSRVAFLSTAADLVEGDTNNLRDVFLYDRTRGGDEPAGPAEPGGGSCPGDAADAEGYSDLSVDAGEIELTALEQGQPGQVEVTVRNGGGIPSEATTVRLYDGAPGQGTLIGEQSLAELAAGGETTLTFTWDPAGAAGRHTLSVVVDPERLVFEQNVANNEAERSAEVVAPRLELALAPGKPAYGADEAVELATRIANGSVAERSARLVVSLRDEDGEPVAAVHDGQVRIDPNGEANVDAGWNTQDTTPGRYTAAARLLNAVGDELVRAESTFAIEPHVDAGLALETDEVSYGPEETATIAALVTNRSKNSALAGAHVELSLRDPDGELVEGWDLRAGELGQGRSARLGQERALGDLDPGTYEVSAKLLAADGTQLSKATTDFELRSSADTGDGVRGTLSASPTNPYRFTTATFGYSLTNAGNADIGGATLRVRISDLESGETLKRLDEERTITRAGPNTGSLATRADMAEDRDYQASLHLVLPNGSERPLDRAIIHVRPVPFSYGASFDTAPRNRVLVWACEGADESAARSALGDTFATYLTGCGTGGEEQRRFMRLVRGGDHNQLWILGRHHPIERGMGDELAARVIQGDDLLVASARPGHDLNLGGNLSPFGAAFAGNVPPGTHTLQFAAGSAFAGLDAQVGGAPAKLTTTEATGIATTSWGPAGNRKTAISATYNQFGRGKAVYLGAAPSDFADRSKASAVLAEAARLLLPAADVTRAAGMARLELFVEGVAPGSPLEMRTQLPDGMGVPQPPSDATLAGALLTLPFDTDGTQRKERAVWLKLPTGAASASTSSSVFYDDAGETKPYGDPATATLDIAEDKQKARDAALTALGQVGGVSASDPKLQKIRNDIHAATSETTDAAVIFTRLRALLDAIGTLERAKWTNTAPAWTAIARLVTYVEHDYHLAGGK